MLRNFTAMNDSKAMQIILRFLPLVVVGYLIFSLSGGFPATNWQLLLLILIYLNALHAVNSSSLRLPVAILSIQSLLLIVAWVWLIIFSIRDIRAYLNDDEEEVSPGYRKPPVRTPLTSAIKVKMPVFNTKKLENDIHDTPARILADGQQGAPSYMQPAMGMVTLNATSNIAEPVEKTKQAGSSMPVKKSQMPFRQAKSSIATNAANNSKKQEPPHSPFDVQPEVLSIFDQSDAFDEVNAIKEASRAQNAKKGKAIENAVVNASLVEKPVEKPVRPEFVFGNPFEGPLPEVFEYDTDLKKSIFDSGQSSSKKSFRN